MSSVAWYSAFGALPALAINTMMQPWGRVCGFNPSLRTYLRSSPIICIFDAVAILIRFFKYLSLGLSPSRAAKRVVVAREAIHAVNDHRGGLPEIDKSFVLKALLFVVGVLPQALKLMACSGVPWTKTWASFYLVEFLVVGTMKLLASSEDVEEPRDYWLDLMDKILGGIAVLVQLSILAWIDLAVVPPNILFAKRWGYWMLRFCGQLVIVLVHLPLAMLQFDITILGLTGDKALVLSSFFTCAFFALIHWMDLRYTQKYFM
jgi:hypothetical protein